MNQRLRLITLVALVVFCFSALAVNHFPVGYAHSYYSGPDRQTLVGEYIRECDGSVYSWGAITSHKEYQEWPCPH